MFYTRFYIITTVRFRFGLLNSKELEDKCQHLREIILPPSSEQTKIIIQILR
jgi:hypothetical protein